MKTPEAFCSAIVKMVCNHFDYFRANPKHMAWAMMNYELIHRAGRSMGRCGDNPKDAVIDAGNSRLGQIRDEEDANFLYDSWAQCISNYAEFPDVKKNADPRWFSLNKTVEDWVDLLTSPDYQYKYSSEYEVRDSLLCTLGSGYGWNKDGYIDQVGPCDVQKSFFHGYTHCENEVRKDLRERILRYRSHPYIKQYVDDYMVSVNINAGDDNAAKEYINNSWKLKMFGEKYRRNLNKYPPISAEAVAVLLKQYKCLCYLNELLNLAKEWDDKTWEEWSNKNYWIHYDYILDVSEITVDFPLSQYGFESLIEHEIEHDQFSMDIDYRTKNDMSARRIAEIYEFLLEIPEAGWETVKWMVKLNIHEKGTTRKRYYEDKKPTHYPLSSYSKLTSMPDHAHDSYWKAGVKTALEILDEPPSCRDIKKYAHSFLERALKLGKYVP